MSLHFLVDSVEKWKQDYSFYFQLKYNKLIEKINILNRLIVPNSI